MQLKGNNKGSVLGLVAASMLAIGLVFTPATALAEEQDTEQQTIVENVVQNEVSDPVVTTDLEQGVSENQSTVTDFIVNEDSSSVDSSPVDEQTGDTGDANQDEVDIQTQTVPDPVENGATFIIESGSAGNETQVFDAAGGKSDSGTNIQTYVCNNTDAQKYTFTKATKEEISYSYVTIGDEVITVENKSIVEDTDDEGNPYYWISLAGTNQVLDVAGGKNVAGTNVQLWKNNGSDAQKWKLVDTGDGRYKVVSKLVTDNGKALVLEVQANKKASGTNIQIYVDNNTEAQRFYLLDPNPDVAPSNYNLEDGVYTVASYLNSNFVFDVASGSKDKGANIQIYKSNNTAAQKYIFVRDDDGYYTIGILGSAKVLDVAGAKVTPTTNVQQWNYNGSDAQKWALMSSDGVNFTIINKRTGLALQMAGEAASGTNVRGYRVDGTDEERFKLTKVANSTTNLLGVGDEVTKTSIYTIYAAGDLNYVLDIASGSKEYGGKVQLYKSNNSSAQKYQLELVGDNLYRIRTAASGDYLTDTGNGSQVLQQDGTTWKIVLDKSGYFVFQSTSGRVLEVAEGTYAAGTIIQTGAVKDNASQHFILKLVDLIIEKTYYVNSRVSGKTLDINSAKKVAGDYVQIYGSNRSAAQQFKVVKVGDYYQLINVNSNMAVAGGGSADPDGYPNVLQASTNSSDKKQLWKVVVGNDGYIEFINVASGKNLYNCYDNGGDLNVVERDFQSVSDRNAGNNGKSWKLVIVSGWSKVDGHWFFTSDDPRAEFEKLLSPHSKSLNHFDILHQAWMYVNGKVSGSNKPFHSKTGYLICSIWDDCYVAIFKGEANSTKAENWEPLFGWNCGNGSAAVIEGKVKEKNPSSTWKWDPNWNRYLAEGNVKGNVPELEPQDTWAASLDTTWSGSRRNPIKKGSSEKYFTSISWTLGYHTTITSKPSNELGHHVSNGCTRLTEAHAKWIYDNIGPGTRVMQCTYKKLTTAS